MLIEFKVENFRSFKEEQTFSLAATPSDKSHPNNLIECERGTLLKGAGIFGANASGKSNLIKAIDFARRFVRNSATGMTIGDPVEGISPFKLDVDFAGSPSKFEFLVQLDGVDYQYGFAATTERVHDEWLFVRQAGPRKRFVNWFEREFDTKADKTNWQIRGPLKDNRAELVKTTRENCLLLSRAANLNFVSINRLYWFVLETIVIDLSSHFFGDWTEERIKDVNTFKGDVLELLRDADTGIDDITIKERSEKIPLTGVISATMDHRSEIVTRHRVSGTDEFVDFDLRRDESNGTQRLFDLAGLVLTVLARGSLLVLDELDSSLHPLLSRKIIAMFQSPSLNKNGAQLVFTTHDTTLMDPNLLRRDQIWIAEKNADRATEMFSLSDIKSSNSQRGKTRGTERFDKNYLAGRYGGVPDFGPSLEDLEFE
jgi:hypothetical protein